MELKDKKVAVVGLGISGLSASLFLKEKGALVRLTDRNDNPEIRERALGLKDKDIECELGRHTEDFLKETELLVVSPGVEGDSLPIKWAQERKIPIISEIELGYLYCPGIIIAVSGTNGKSTVVSLLGDTFKKSGKDAFVCGNIGRPFTSVVSDTTRDSFIILEVSSFQLEWIEEFRPHIGILLNITEDHLDRYKNFDEYVNAKLKIFMNQRDTDFTIINYENKRFQNLKASFSSNLLYFSKHRLPKEYDGIFVENNELVVRRHGRYAWIGNRDSLSLSGEHNLENSLASGLASYILGVEPDIIKDALYNFKPLSHRFETVGVIKGIRFIDDSKATNVDSARRAIQSSPKGIILIAGGRDKGGDYGVLAKVLKEKVKSLFLIGEAKERIAAALSGIVPITFAETLDDAVARSFKEARSGDTVLLSPMCSSFDMFRDYKERGEVFRRKVEEIKKDA